MEKHLHIIAFDNPFPPTYGGAIDVFYRIQELAASKVHITLHCFYLGDLRISPELEKLCEKVYYYPRKASLGTNMSIRPASVVSRTHKDLLMRLMEDDAPILFEGLVSCALLSHPSLRFRKKFYRECNVEHDYYRALGKASSCLWRKLFYYIEAEKLKRFEKNLKYADTIFAIGHQDEAYFKKQYPNINTVYVPCFHQFTKTNILNSTGNYILYHGNLAVAENHKAAMYILKHITPHISFPFVIAGANPKKELKQAVASCPNVRLVDTPDMETMEQLVREAQIHLLITFQPTGIKLKLLNVLYSGRHVVVNPYMVVGTTLSPLCHIGKDSGELIKQIHSLINLPMTSEIIAERQTLLNQAYNNKKSVQLILDYL